MYIIEEGKVYLIDGEVGYQINFDIDGKMLVDKEKTIEIEGKAVYTFDEMYAKLNIAHMINEAKKKNAMSDIENEIIDELNKKVAQLEEKNKELKEQLEASKTAEEENKIEPEEVDAEPEVETNKKEKK